MKRSFIRPLAVVAAVCLATLGVVGGVYGANATNAEAWTLKVLRSAQIKALDLGGDPASGTDGVTLTGPSASGVGAIAGSGVTVTEQNVGAVHTTTITFADRAIALTDEAGVVAYGGSKIYDLPEGAILFLGATTDIALTKSSAGVNATWDGDFGIGTATAGNDATLATTEQNLLPTTATPQAVAGVTTSDGESTTSENVVINGTGTALDVYLNYLVDDADHDVTGTACNLIVNGTVTVTWINLGDN